MSECFPKRKSLGANVKVQLHIFSYATKADFKNLTDADTLKFAEEVNLNNLKPDVDKLDIDKLKNVPTDLSYSKSK